MPYSRIIYSKRQELIFSLLLVGITMICKSALAQPTPYWKTQLARKFEIILGDENYATQLIQACSGESRRRLQLAEIGRVDLCGYLIFSGQTSFLRAAFIQAGNDSEDKDALQTSVSDFLTTLLASKNQNLIQELLESESGVFLQKTFKRTPCLQKSLFTYYLTHFFEKIQIAEPGELLDKTSDQTLIELNFFLKYFVTHLVDQGVALQNSAYGEALETTLAQFLMKIFSLPYRSAEKIGALFHLADFEPQDQFHTLFAKTLRNLLKTVITQHFQQIELGRDMTSSLILIDDLSFYFHPNTSSHLIWGLDLSETLLSIQTELTKTRSNETSSLVFQMIESWFSKRIALPSDNSGRDQQLPRLSKRQKLNNYIEARQKDLELRGID